MFNSIPRTRLFVYALLMGSIPICLTVFYLYLLNQKTDELAEALLATKELALLKEKRQSINLAVRQHFQNSDHFYIDKYLEAIPLLQNEVEILQKLLKNHNFIENETVKKRLDTLNAQNSLVFSEGIVQKYPYFTETVETLVHSIEVTVSDLEELLSKIEGVNMGTFTPGSNPPQLIITDFKLDRKKALEKNETFQLNLKLIKREFF